MKLPFDLTEEALSAAMANDDPESLRAAARMRSRYGADLAAAALTQAALRRQAKLKFGEAALEMFFTRAGLEQAARAGLEVVAVEVDHATAAVAGANLAGRAEVIAADASEVAGRLMTPGVGVFCDPSRRTDRGRVWRVEDFTPAWSFVSDLLNGTHVAGVKLGPALPHSLIPDVVEAEWITHRGETVEAALWAGPGTRPGQRAALVMPNARLIAAAAPSLPVRELGRYLYEPAGAVIRAGAITELGAQLDAGVLHSQIAYLTSDRLHSTPFATAFEVCDRLPYHLKALRQWVREAQIGVLEIKKRGIDIDPAELRRRLRLTGPNSATIVISSTPSGALVAIVERV
jgi:hypothetical protein